jgi:ribonucleoside-diphosphate reductase alpha chain
MMNDGEIDWDKLAGTVHKAVRFLDNVIDTSRFPLPRIEQLTKANRKIGLGVMGFAEMLIRMGIPYDADEALTVARRVMQFITDTAREASVELARERGSFPNFESSVWRREGYECLRNATVTSVAPTGTIGLIAGVSSGIEPVFALSYFRNIADGTRLLEQNALFEKAAGDRGFYAPDLMASIARSGSIRGEERIPEDVRRLFVTALDISPECHVKMQAAFQQYTDNGVSKTVNLPYDATVRDVRDACSRTSCTARVSRCIGTARGSARRSIRDNR